MRSHTLDTDDGARIAYHATGDGPVQVVLVHGWMASHRIWRRLLAELGGVAVVAIDLRGTGASSTGSASTSLLRMAADVRAVLEALGTEPVHLVGHSMGGQLAQLVAATMPGRLRSLILLNPVPIGGLPLPPAVATSFRGAGGSRAALGGILDTACRTLSPEAREEAVDEAMKIATAVIADGFDAWAQGEAGARLEDIDAPTRVVATDDPFLPPAVLEAQVVRRIRGASLEVLPGPGHYPQLEAPVETASLVRRVCGLP